MLLKHAEMQIRGTQHEYVWRILRLQLLSSQDNLHNPFVSIQDFPHGTDIEFLNRPTAQANSRLYRFRNEINIFSVLFYSILLN